MDFFKKIFNDNLVYIALVIMLVELFSFLGHLYEVFNILGWVSIVVITAYLTFKDLRWGLFIAIAELVIGSQGYLFFIDFGFYKLSLRLGIFIVIFLIWLFKYFKPGQWIKFITRDKLTQSVLMFGLIIMWGVLNGLMKNNAPTEVFLDFNGYLYWCLLPIFIQVFKDKENIVLFLQVLFAGVFVSTFKVLGLLYFFSHKFYYLLPDLYTWVRDTRVAEIAQMPGGFSRIFLQSQIYSLFTFFIIIFLLCVCKNKMKKIMIFKQENEFVSLIIVFVLAITSIVISFSRSIWFGGLAGFIFLIFLIIKYFKEFKREWLKIFLFALVSTIVSVTILFITVKVPFPQSTGAFNVGMLQDRFSSIENEAAVSSRWNLLPVLANKSLEHPLLGSGFGTRVEYKSEDPRNVTIDNPEGIYSTFTFEWGYLDTITEIGLLGLAVLITIIVLIFIKGFQAIKAEDIELRNVSGGLLVAFFALLITHFFTPYLNHPLGIGFLMVLIGWFTTDYEQTRSKKQNR